MIAFSLYVPACNRGCASLWGRVQQCTNKTQDVSAILGVVIRRSFSPAIVVRKGPALACNWVVMVRLCVVIRKIMVRLCVVIG